MDSKPKALKYYQNGQVTDVASVADHVDGNNIFGLAIANNKAYISVWNSGRLLTVDLSTKVVNRVSVDLSNNVAMFSIISWTTQPSGIPVMM